MRVRFGTCVLDTDRRELACNESAKPLTPKAFRLLEVLAERQPHAVSQAELRALVWPDVRAGGTTLARLIHEIRQSLGGEARFIRTVPRFGYALNGAVIEHVTGHQGHAFSLEWEKQWIRLAAGENVIGRGAHALVSVPSSKVSRRHARIVVSGNQAMLEDLGSKNGTCIGAMRIDNAVELRNGDRITIGDAVLIFHVGSEQDATASASDEHTNPA